MADKTYVYLSLFCVILCQGITEVFSEDVGESNSLFRRKRVISFEPGEDIPLRRDDAPYVVNIKQYPSMVEICVGTILSKRTVITAAHCVFDLHAENIKILSSSIHKSLGISHNVKEIKLHVVHHTREGADGIALLIVELPFHFNAMTYFIKLHDEPLQSGTHAITYGWGCNPTAPHGTQYVERLRSIIVPIMYHRDCVNSYRNHFMVSDKHICTYHPKRRCGHTDGGAPLIVNNALVGIYLWTPLIQGQPSPDVFADIKDLDYGQWIRNNIV